MPSGQRKVAVIGGGIAGLTIAYELGERAARMPEPIDVSCLEAGNRTGGHIRSERDRGFLFEWAANGFLDSAPGTVTLVRRLGLEDRLLGARETASRRYIHRRGKLREVPTGAASFLTSSVLPLGARLRVLLEPLVRARRAETDESVAAFAARRIGKTAAYTLVDAMVSGVYAGDARRLSVGATFPKMQRFEREHGSLFRALLARRREARDSGETAGGPAGPGGRLSSFIDGMQELTDGLTRALGPRVHLRTPVDGLTDLGRRGFRLHLREGAPLDVDAVVVAVPAWAAAAMFASFDERAQRRLLEIETAPVAVVHLGFRSGALPARDPAFGFLVPRGEGARILGCLWSSDLFEHRAPDGSMLLTSMIGGAHDPEATLLGDRDLIEIARRDLRTIMGIQADPYVQVVLRHARGIPQYNLGHLDRLAELDECAAAHPGIWLAGSSYRGVAVNDCVAEAPAVAEQVLEFLTEQLAHKRSRA